MTFKDEIATQNEADRLQVLGENGADSDKRTSDIAIDQITAQRQLNV